MKQLSNRIVKVIDELIDQYLEDDRYSCIFSNNGITGENKKGKCVYVYN